MSTTCESESIRTRLHKRTAQRASSSERSAAGGESLFTTPNPFASLPSDEEDPHVGSRPSPSPPKHPRIDRRHSSELRAIAANRFKREQCASSTMTPSSPHRRASVEVEAVTDRLRSRRLSSLQGERRRSSTPRRRRSSAAPVTTIRHLESFSFDPLKTQQFAATRRSLSPGDSPNSLDGMPTFPISNRRCAFSEVEERSRSVVFPEEGQLNLTTAIATRRRKSSRDENLASASLPRLRPRSPHHPTSPAPPLETLSHPRMSRSRICGAYVESPSGVQMQYPFVFPSAPSTRSPSLSTSLRTNDTDVSVDCESSRGAVAQVEPDPRWPTFSFPSTTRSRPTFHLDLSLIPDRRQHDEERDRRVSTTSSSFQVEQHQLLTPGTICLAHTPLCTSRSYQHGAAHDDIFADAFAGALGGRKEHEASP